MGAGLLEDKVIQLRLWICTFKFKVASEDMGCWNTSQLDGRERDLQTDRRRKVKRDPFFTLQMASGVVEV